MSSWIPNLSSSEAIDLSVALASVGLVIQGVEDIRYRHSFADHSLLSWRIDRTAYRDRSLVQRILDCLFHPYIFSLFLALRAVIPALSLLSFLVYGTVPSWLIVSLLALTFMFGLRSKHGLDGSHHMFLVVLLPCAVARLYETQVVVVQLCLWYIAIQLSLSYFISGAVKAVGTPWRSGAAFAGIFSTEAYGSPPLVQLSRALPAFGFVFCWCVILYEILFPAVFLAPVAVQVGLILIGLSFHLSIAIFMGLNKFVWAWWSAYPSLIWALTRT